MKIIAINQIEFNDKSGKKVVIVPGQTFDIPADSAERLLTGLMPAARRMTSDEIELDKARAANKAAAKPADDADGSPADDADDSAAKKAEDQKLAKVKTKAAVKAEDY